MKWPGRERTPGEKILDLMALSALLAFIAGVAFGVMLGMPS